MSKRINHTPERFMTILMILTQTLFDFSVMA